MQIGIIGAGFTGLAAAKKLVKAGHSVTVIERAEGPGGLAAGFVCDDWEWPLEKHYHHIFTTDRVIRTLASEIGVPLNFHEPLTSTYYGGVIRQLDSPISLLKFSALGVKDRLRTAVGLALLKYNPFWVMFEGLTAKKYIISVMGESSWKVIWEPLFVGKFGSFADSVSATWFWARITARSQKLGYPDGGFTNLATKLAEYIAAQGTKILYNRVVTRIHKENSGFKVSLSTGNSLNFDRVLCTLPCSVFTQIASDLPEDYAKVLNSRSGLGAVTLILSLKKQFMQGVYWLNINDRTMPFIAVVEHTNFIPGSHYNADSLLYIGNYLPADHRYFSKTPAELIREFMTHLQKINPSFSPKEIKSSWVWKTPFAQPVFTTNAAMTIPRIRTPVPGLFLAGMQQVYPWDRGINYAVELGYRAAREMQK